MNNADKFLVAVQTGLLVYGSQGKGGSFNGFDAAEKMLDAIKISEKYEQDGWEPSDYAMKSDVESFLKWALLGTKYEWIESKLK